MIDHDTRQIRRKILAILLAMTMVLSVLALGAGTVSATAVDDSAVDSSYDGLVASTPSDGDATSASHVVTVPVGSTLAGEEVTRINVTYPDFVDADNIGSSSEVQVSVLSGGSVSDTDTIGTVNEPGGNNNVEVDLSSTTTTLSQGDIVRIRFSGNGSIDQSAASATDFTVDSAEVTLSAADIEQEQSNDVDFPLNGPIEANDGSSTQTYVSLAEAASFASGSGADPSIEVLNVGALDGNALDETLTQDQDLTGKDEINQIKISGSFTGTFDINGNDETIGTPVNDGTPIFEIDSGGNAVDIDNLALDAAGGAVTPTTKNKQALKITAAGGPVDVSDSNFDNTGQGSNPTLEINDDGTDVKINNTRLDGGVGVSDKGITGFGSATLNVTNNDVVNVGGNNGIDLQSTGGTLVVDQNTISGVSGTNTGLNLDIAPSTTLESADGATRQITGNDITMSGDSTGIAIEANARSGPDENITLVDTQIQGDGSSDDTGVSYSTGSPTTDNIIDFNITESATGTTEIGPVQTGVDITGLTDNGGSDHDIIIKNGANLTTSDNAGSGVILNAGVGTAGNTALGIDVTVDDAVIAGPSGSPGGKGLVLDDGGSNKVIQSLTVDPDTDATGAGTEFKNLDKGIEVRGTDGDLTLNKRAANFDEGLGKISGPKFTNIQGTAMDFDLQAGGHGNGISGAKNTSLSGDLETVRFENIEIVLDDGTADGIIVKPDSASATDIVQFSDINVSSTTTAGTGIQFDEKSDSTTFGFDPNTETIAGVNNGVDVADANKIRQNEIVDDDPSLTFDSISGSALYLQDIGTTTSLTIDNVSAADSNDNDGTVVDLDDDDVSSLDVTRADFGSDGSGGISTPVGTGIDVTDADGQTVTVSDADIGVETTGITTGTGTSDDLVLSGSTGDILIEGDDAGTAISADGNSLQINDDVGVEIREHQAASGSSYGFTNGIDAADVDLDPGSDDTLDDLTFSEMESGTALDIDSLTGLSGSTLTIDGSSTGTFSVDSATGGTTALAYSASEALTVSEPTIGNNGAVDTGISIEGGTNNKVTIDSPHISLATGGGTGISAEPTNAEVEFQNDIAIDGPSISAPSDHATAGITVDAGSNPVTLTSLAGSDDFDISGVDKGFHVKVADSVDKFHGVTFTEIGGTDGTEAALLSTASNPAIDAEDVTVEFAHPQSTGGIAVHVSDDDLTLDNASVTQTAGDNAPDAGVKFSGSSSTLSLDTNANTDSNIDNSTISDVDKGVQVTDASSVSDIEGTTFTAVGSQAVDIDSPGLSGQIRFEITVDGDSSSATGIEFDDGSGAGLIVDSASSIGSSGAGVDTGVDVEAVGDTVTVESGTTIGLASGATDGVLLQYSENQDANVNGISVTGSGDGDGIDINAGSSDGTFGIDDSGASTITDVDTGLNIRGIGGSGTLNTISGTTFDSIATDGISADADIGQTLDIDDIDVENSQGATAINGDLGSSQNDLEVENSRLGTTGTVGSGISFNDGASADQLGKLDLTNVNITLADGSGVGVEHVENGDGAGNLVIDGLSVNGSGSTGINVDANATVENIDTVAFVNDTQTGIDISSANDVNTDITNIDFDDIGKSDSGAAVTITTSLSSDPAVTNLNIGLDDHSATALELGNDNDYSVSNVNVTGTAANSGTAVDFTGTGTVDFDSTVDSSAASDISGVDSGVVFGGSATVAEDATGATVNNTQFTDIGSKAIDFDDASTAGAAQFTAADITVDSSSSGTAIEFDSSSDTDALVVQNVDVSSGSVQEGVNVEAASQVNVTDSSITVTDDSAAAGILVDDSSNNPPVGIERNTITSAASSDGSGAAIHLDAFGGSGSSIIFLNDLEGFTANDGYGLDGNNVNNLAEESAIANYWGSDLGPNAANGSDVALGGVTPSEVRVYDPHLTVNTSTLVENIDDANAQTLDEVRVDYIRDFAHSMVIEAGDQMVFPGDSGLSLDEAYDVKGGSQDTGQQAFEFNETTNSYDPITDNSTQPNAFEDVAFEFEDSDLSATLAVKFEQSGSSPREVEYQEGYNLVAARSNATLDSNLDVENGTSVTESEQTFGLQDSDLNLSNVTISTVSAPAGAPYGQDFVDFQDAEDYNVSNDINADVSPFAVTFVKIEQDGSTFDGVTYTTNTPTTMDEVVDRGGNDNTYEFKNETTA